MTTLEEAKENFLLNLNSLQGDDLSDFLTFVGTELLQKDGEIMANDETDSCSKEAKSNSTDTIQEIIDTLREELPITAMAPTEKTIIPKHDEEFTDYTENNTIHVDAFLYDDEEVDRLCDEGLLSRAVCLKCGSNKTQMLNFISHSASLPQLQFIFQHALPSLKGKTVVDVGSRTGAVLFSGYHLSDAEKLIGVEMNDYFCKLSSKIANQFKLTDRVSIIEGDIVDNSDVLRSADVVILNNVFQFFHKQETQSAFWVYLKKVIKSGTLLITVPSLAESLKSAGYLTDIKTWVEKLSLDYEDFDSDEESDIYNIHMYLVK